MPYQPTSEPLHQNKTALDIPLSSPSPSVRPCAMRVLVAKYDRDDDQVKTGFQYNNIILNIKSWIQHYLYTKIIVYYTSHDFCKAQLVQ